MAPDGSRFNLIKFNLIGLLFLITFEISYGQRIPLPFSTRNQRIWRPGSIRNQIPRSLMTSRGLGLSPFMSNPRQILTSQSLSSIHNSFNDRWNLDDLVPSLSEVRVPSVRRNRVPVRDSTGNPINIVQRPRSSVQRSAITVPSQRMSSQQLIQRNVQNRQSQSMLRIPLLRGNAGRAGNVIPQVLSRAPADMTSSGMTSQVIRIPSSVRSDKMIRQIRRLGPLSPSRIEMLSSRSRQPSVEVPVQVRQRIPITATVAKQPQNPQTQPSLSIDVNNHNNIDNFNRQIQFGSPHSGSHSILPAGTQNQASIQNTHNIVQNSPVVTNLNPQVITHAQPPVLVKQLPVVTSSNVVPQQIQATGSQSAVATSVIQVGGNSPTNVITGIQQGVGQIISQPQTSGTVSLLPVTQNVAATTNQLQSGTLVQASLQPGQQLASTGSAATTASGTSDILFEELVNAFTDVLQQQNGGQTVGQGQGQILPTMPNQHPQIVQNSMMIQPQQPGLVQSHGMIHHGHVMGNPMFGGHMGMMNPWMMGRMTPDMMQEMMFGDTTDPPDPVPTTTVAPTVNAVPASNTSLPAAPLEVVQAVNTSLPVAPIDAIPAAKASIPVVPIDTVTSVKTSLPVEHKEIPALPVVNTSLPFVPTKSFVPEPLISNVPGVTESKAPVDSVTAGDAVLETKIQISPVVEVPLVEGPQASQASVGIDVPVVITTPSPVLASDFVTKPLVLEPSAGIPEIVSSQEAGTIVSTTHSSPRAEAKPAPKTLEEKIMAEVKMMLANQKVDMSLLSQVMGQVVAEVQATGPEMAPSATMLGLTTPGPGNNESLTILSKKEKVKELIGATRGVVSYPPTVPSIVKPAGPDPVPLTEQQKDIPITKVKTSNKTVTVTIPPHVDIPTLPPSKDKVHASPDIYRTLETILNHDPAAIVKVMEGQGHTISPPISTTQGPKLSIQSLVDLGNVNNFANLESILKDISSAQTIHVHNLTAIGSEFNISDVAIVTEPGLLNATLTSLPTSAIESILNSTQHFLNVEGLVANTPLPTYDVMTGVDGTHVNAVNSMNMTPTTSPLQNTTQELGVNQAKPVSTDSFHGNNKGIAVDIAVEKLAREPRLANMEGIPVHVERISEVTTTSSHVIVPINKDVSGALAILNEIRSFKKNSHQGSTTSLTKDIATKLSDPSFVQQLRGLLKNLMHKAERVSSTTPTPSTSVSTEVPEMTTEVLPVFSTEEYELEDMTTPSS